MTNCYLSNRLLLSSFQETFIFADSGKGQKEQKSTHRDTDEDEMKIVNGRLLCVLRAGPSSSKVANIQAFFR